MGTTHALSPPAMENSQQQSALWSPSYQQVQAEIKEQIQMSCTPFQSYNPLHSMRGSHTCLQRCHELILGGGIQQKLLTKEKVAACHTPP